MVDTWCRRPSRDGDCAEALLGMGQARSDDNAMHVWAVTRGG
jgi:hypothetical protein